MYSDDIFGSLSISGIMTFVYLLPGATHCYNYFKWTACFCSNHLQNLLLFSLFYGYVN